MSGALAPACVSGWGMVTPLGHTLEALGQAARAGASAVRAHRLALPGVEPAWLPLAACDWDDTVVRVPSRMPADRGTAMALAAVRDALACAELDLARTDPLRIGVFWGSGMAGAHSFDRTCESLYAQQRRLRPTTVLTIMPNAAVAEIALELGVHGPAQAYACACASSTVAIGEAARAVRAGWLDVAIAGGHDAMLSPGVLAAWSAMRVLAPLAGPDDPQAPSACRPFAADRRGFAMGEGAAAVVLESAAHARARGVRAELALSGYATGCDGRHITQPDAAGQVRVLRAALRDAGLAPQDIGYANAHGTATQAGDAAEAASLAEVFGPQGVPVSSTKAVHGHLLGGGGAVELLVALDALRTQALPPTAHLDTPDPAFALDLVRGTPRAAPGLRHVLSSSFAFGGTNAVLVASRLPAGD